MPLSNRRFDAIARGGNVFAAATGAATRPRQFGAVAKHEAAIRADGRFQKDPAGFVSGDRLDHMRQVFLNLPLSDIKHLRKLSG